MVRLITGRTRRANIWAVSFIGLLLCFSLASCGSVVATSSTAAVSINQRLSWLSGYLDDAKQAESRGQTATVKADVQRFASGWQQIRREALQRAPEQAQAIDVALERALTVTGNAASPHGVLNDLDATVDRFLVTTGQKKVITIAGEGRILEEALHALQSGNPLRARQKLAAFAGGWPLVETQVHQQDAQTYALVERLLPTAQQALEAQPLDVSLAVTAIQQMESALQHSSAAATSYGPLDAAVILVREGLEAILVTSALLAVLRKSDARDQQHWLWLGGAAGILASAVLALLIRMVFTEMETSVSPELLEGIAGVFAAR